MRARVTESADGAASRRAIARPFAQADNWRLTADIECGNADFIRHVGPNHFETSPRADTVPLDLQKKGVISSYLFCCRITNDGARTRELTLDVIIPAWMFEAGPFDYFLRAPYYLREPETLEWRQADAEWQTDLPDRVRVKLPLGGDASLIISTVPSCPYTAACMRLHELAESGNNRAQVLQIGESTLGRPILALKVGEATAPRLTFCATVQSGEPSTWAILAMAGAALHDPDIIGLTGDRYCLEFIPVTNPDGVAYGYCNTNARGELLLLSFADAADGNPGSEEAAALWNYLNMRPPAALIDFHFLDLCRHEKPKPYVVDGEVYPDAAGRETGARLTKALLEMCDTEKGYQVRAGDSMWEGLLIYQAIERWSTPAFLFQNTGVLTSVEQSQEIAVELVRTVLTTLHDVDGRPPHR